MPQLLVCETLKMVVFIELRIFLLLSVYLLWQKQSVRYLWANCYLQNRKGLKHIPSLPPLTSRNSFPVRNRWKRWRQSVCNLPLQSRTGEVFFTVRGTVTVDHSLTVFDDRNNAAAVFLCANCPWKAAVIVSCNNHSSFISRHNRLCCGNNASG